MSDQKPTAANNADEITEKPGDIQLNEEDKPQLSEETLDKVSGGFSYGTIKWTYTQQKR